MDEVNEVGSTPSPRKIDGIVVIPKPTLERLSERQLVDYHDHRSKLIRWVLKIGKDPQHGEGYAYQTAKIRCARLDQFYRFVWNSEGRYTIGVAHEHADAYMKELAYSDISQENKASHQKTVKMLFRWREGSSVRKSGSLKLHSAVIALRPIRVIISPLRSARKYAKPH